MENPMGSHKVSVMWSNFCIQVINYAAALGTDCNDFRCVKLQYYQPVGADEEAWTTASPAFSISVHQACIKQTHRCIYCKWWFKWLVVYVCHKCQLMMELCLIAHTSKQVESHCMQVYAASHWCIPEKKFKLVHIQFQMVGCHPPAA